MKKSIVFFVVNDLTFDQRMIRISTSLAKAGYTVTLVGRVLPGSLPLTQQPFNQKRLKCFFRKGPLFYIEFNLRIFLYLLVNRHDALCACDLDTALPVHLIGLLKRKARVFDAHEYFTEVPEVMDRPFVKAVWKRIGRITIPHFALRYTVNQALAKELEKVYGAHFEVIRNLPEADMHETNGNAGIRAAHDQRLRIILYQGALNAGRGLEQMIKAMPHIRDAELWLVGEGDLSNMLRELAISTGHQERITFMGKKTPDELREITPLATLGLNLLIPDSLNYYYSLANKFFDYMHAGVPSVNMCFPAYTEILEKHPVGICISSLEPTVLAEKINALIEDHEALRKMKKEALQARESFRWQAESGKLIEIYSRLLDS